MHIDITDELKKCLARQPRKKDNTHPHDNSIASNGASPHVASHHSSTKTRALEMAVSMATTTPTSVTDQTKPIEDSPSNNQKSKPTPPERMITLQVELHDNEELNISHISISAVVKKSTNEVNHRYDDRHYHKHFKMTDAWEFFFEFNYRWCVSFTCKRQLNASVDLFERAHFHWTHSK